MRTPEKRIRQAGQPALDLTLPREAIFELFDCFEIGLCYNVFMSYILAIDQGTTGTRAYLFDKNAQPKFSAYQEFTQYYPRPGWVEHDAEEIWQSTRRVIRLALEKGRVRPSQIAAIGITNQRETAVLWDRRTSRPAARAIVWQCRRTTEMCEKLKRRRGLPGLFQKKTGLVIDPYFSGTKIKWLLDQSKHLRRQARRGQLAFGTIDSWLIWKLTGGTSHVTDYTNASRTLCFDIEKKCWSPELLKILNLPAALFPKPQNSSSLFGKTSALGFLPDGIPITGAAGDQQAAFFGQGGTQAGAMKNTYGTGCFLMVNTGSKPVRSKNGFLTTLACGPTGRPCYALEGAVFIAGAAIQWLRDELHWIRSAKETGTIARRLNDTGGVYMVPAFVGLGAPHWNPHARGIITGLTRGSNRDAITRAALESIAYQTKDVVEVIKSELHKKISSLRVDGGAASNDFLMQFQADILNTPILRPKFLETTARGTALLAGLHIGLYSSKQIKPDIDRRFLPRMSEVVRGKLYRGWRHAVAQALA